MMTLSNDEIHTIEKPIVDKCKVKDEDDEGEIKMSDFQDIIHKVIYLY